MTVKNVTALAEELERYLGDPHDPSTVFSFERVLRCDEREQDPYELVGELQRWNLHEYCLPRRWGGRAGDVEVGFTLLRLVGRRDPTAATALMLTDLAFMPAWIAGTEEQRLRYVRAINQGAKMAWGLSEREHGSDVLGNEMRAERVPGGYLLTGEKYLIGNASRADIVTVHARVNERGGPGDWSLFAIEKREAPAGAVVELPDERLHGLRALDMSGIRLDGLFVPESARIGAEGQGLEIALKSAQVARTTIASLAMGAVDTAMRVTLDFVTHRVIFGQTVADIPYTRRQLAESFADMVLADAGSTGAVRGLQACPEQVSLLSSIVKYFVPTLLERTMAQLNVVLGARLYLRAHPHYGIYQKMLRDVLVAIFADGNTVVNLKNVALQLDTVFGAITTADATRCAAARERIGPMFDLDAELPEWEPAKQTLFSRDGDLVVLAMPAAVEELRGWAAEHPDPAQRDWYTRSAAVADRLLVELDGLMAERIRLKEALGKGYGSSAELFRLAERYTAIHMAAASLHLVLGSRTALREPFPDGALTLLCLERVWRVFHPGEPVTDVAVVDRVMEILLGLHAEKRLFSPWQFQLSASGEHERS